MDEATLERDEPAVRRLHALRGLHKLLYGVAAAEHGVDEPADPPRDAVLWLGQPTQCLLEVFLRVDLLLVELGARVLQLPEGVPQTGEVDGLDDVRGRVVENPGRMSALYAKGRGGGTYKSR